MQWELSLSYPGMCVLATIGCYVLCIYLFRGLELEIRKIKECRFISEVKANMSWRQYMCLCVLGGCISERAKFNRKGSDLRCYLDLTPNCV